MRILMFPPALRIGGSQLNALELAEELHRRGHDVVVFSEDGPLRSRVEAAGLPFEPAPARPKARPWPATAARLANVARRYRVDVVHGYEWPPILEAAYGPFLRSGTPVVGTVMSMGVAPFIPRHLPLVVGTAQIAGVERERRQVVELVEPPVDVVANQPGMGGAVVRRELGIDADAFAVVVVSRLANELKREGLLEAVRAAGALAAEMPIRLVVVGDGPARPEIEASAREANAAAGRAVVTLTGSVVDPRGFYDAADVVLGMGSSALRGMAFAKPLVVQGERGFWRLLDPSSLETFLHQGWYGIGAGVDGAPQLTEILRALHANPTLRESLGTYSRSIVVDRFSLERAGAVHERIYEKAQCAAPSRLEFARHAAAPLARAFAHEAEHWLAVRRGQGAAEDFNQISAQARPEPSLRGTP
jgi:glycosyltransferase involved in cell wall biosynthesis